MHVRTNCALGLAVLLVLSAVSAPIGPAVAMSSDETTASDAGAEPTGQASGPAAEAATVNESIDALRAMEIARNQTNGTVVGVQRKREGEAERDNVTLIYEVYVIQGNESATNRTATNRRIVVLEVHATKQTVISTQPRSELGGLFEDDEEVVPSRSINLSTTRSAVTATRIGVNQSAENVTVNEVGLTLTNNTTSPLAYVVKLENAQGNRVNVIVDARKGKAGVIAVEPQQDDGNSS